MSTGIYTKWSLLCKSQYEMGYTNWIRERRLWGFFENPTSNRTKITNKTDEKNNFLISNDKSLNMKI